MARLSRSYTWTLLGLAALATMPIQSWHVPHWLLMIGAVLAAARPTRGWDLQHYATMAGALALAGISTWLKYGGADFQIGDTPLLAMILLILRAMYQTPPAVKT